MAKIVITPGKTIAFAIAVAFDGIYTKDGHIDSDTLNQDIPKHADKIKGFFIKTKINGEDAFILWQKNTELVKFNQPPRLKTYQLPYLSEVKYSISKAWENAIDKVLKENPSVDTIVLALIPTMRASYFAHLLPEKYTDIKYTSVSLTKISKGYIRRAFENERMLDTAQTRAEYESDACRKRITDLVRVNMSAAMQPFMKRYVQVDQYILTALFMIRTRIRLKGRKRHRIQIVVKAGDASVRAESTMTFSEEDAKRIRTSPPGEVSYNGLFQKKLPTTATLYELFDEYEFSKKDVDQASKALYEKGYITCPFTMNNLLPENFTDIELDRLKKVCLAIYPEQIDDETFEELNYLKANVSFTPYSAIIPLRKGTDGLTDVERVLYECIVKAIVGALEYNREKNVMFKSSNPSIIFEGKYNENVTYPRGKSTLPCVNMTSCEDGTFQPYTPSEFMRELALYNIGTSEVIMTLLDRMVHLDLIRINNYGIFLTRDGEKFASHFPVESFMDPRLCAYWDKALNRIKRNDTEDQDNKRLSDLVSDVEANIEKWTDRVLEEHEASNAAASEADPQEKPQTEGTRTPTKTETRSNLTEPPEEAAPKERPSAEEAATEVPIIPDSALTCPFCQQKALVIEGGEFHCLKCGKTMHSKLQIDDVSYSINDKDLHALTQKKRTGLKFGVDHDGIISDAGYLIITDDQIRLTSETMFTCPYCGNSMHAAHWGFFCSTCNFYIPFKLYEKRLSKEDITALIKGAKTPPIQGMRTPAGELLPEAHILIDGNGKIHFYKKS